MSNSISTQEEYDAKKEETIKNRGEKIEYNEDQMFKATKLMMESVIAEYKRVGYIEPMASFFAGYKKKDGQLPQAMVTLKRAFTDPDSWQNCVGFLRTYGRDLAAHGSVIVCLKSEIAFPQVWKGEMKKWAHGDGEGIFVQLNTVENNYLWFIPLEKKDGRKISDPQDRQLSYDDFQLTPKLILDWDNEGVSSSNS
eukprot:TRINITY_DN364_c0_g1_i2.p1 TRINITY_DN364_c0_g1~~TRINITY_DN364_c0_g1_i2.p1  ORF type:complete len:196 (-),score=79.01 TRINITY_DN364_c0_g1_i2:51-638(-)